MLLGLHRSVRRLKALAWMSVDPVFRQMMRSSLAHCSTKIAGHSASLRKNLVSRFWTCHFKVGWLYCFGPEVKKQQRACRTRLVTSWQPRNREEEEVHKRCVFIGSLPPVRPCLPVPTTFKNPFESKSTEASTIDCLRVSWPHPFPKASLWPLLWQPSLWDPSLEQTSSGQMFPGNISYSNHNRR